MNKRKRAVSELLTVGYTRAVAENGVGEGFDYLSLTILNVTEFNKNVALNNGKREKEEKRKEMRERRREGQKCEAADVMAKNTDPGAAL